MKHGHNARLGSICLSVGPSVCPFACALLPVQERCVCVSVCQWAYADNLPDTLDRLMHGVLLQSLEELRKKIKLAVSVFC